MKKTLLSILLLVLVVALALGTSACDMFKHKHTFSAEWSYDKDEHWLKATCEHEEETSSKAEHNWNSLNMCTTCGYVKDLPPTDYSVTFDANGGEIDYKTDKYKVFKISVAVGETISENVYKKLTATLEGYEFVGWHVDSEKGKLWNFQEDVVNEEVTLVAEWKALFVDVEVNFYINDGTNSEPVVKSTVMGKIDYVPEREGYLFKGWWFGTGRKDSNGYYIVTSKYDTNKAVVNGYDRNLYATWEEKATHITVLSAPNLEVDGRYVTWKQVEGATKYIVKVSGGKLEEPITQILDTGNNESVTYTPNVYGGVYKISVCSVGDGKTSVTSGYSTATVNIAILPGTTISFDATTNMLNWTSVDNDWENECIYSVAIDGKDVATGLKVTYFDMTDFQAGQHTVSIVAEKSSYLPSVTTKTVIKYKLSTPQPVLQSASTEDDYVITWDEIVGADEYHIQIGTKTTVQKENSYTVKADSDARRLGHTFTVYAANSEARYLDSEVSLGIGLGKATNVSVNVAGNVDVTYVDLVPTVYTVTYNYNYEDARDSTVKVSDSQPWKYGTASRSGYAFRGWYTDETCRTLYDFSAPLTGDVTVYAGWRKYDDNEKVDSYVNFVVRNNTSSNSSTVSITGSDKKYVYFTAYADGEYTLHYCNTYSYNSRTRFKVYRAGSTYSPLVNVTGESTSYASATFEVTAGTVYYIEISAYSTSYGATGEYYMTGAEYPAQGGVPKYAYTSQTKTQTLRNDTTLSVLRGTEIEIVAPATSNSRKFLGWYNGEELVSAERTLVITASSDCPYLKTDGAKYIFDLTPKYETGN